MALNLNGFSISQSSTTSFSIGPNVTMIGGYNTASTGLLNPATPAFSGQRTGTGSATNANPWPINTYYVNTGTSFASNVFTCPVAGIYLASCSWILAGQGVASGTSAPNNYQGILKNGSLVRYILASSNDYWTASNLAMMVKCSAGDTLSFIVNTAVFTNGNGTGAYGADLNFATILLIG